MKLPLLFSLYIFFKTCGQLEKEEISIQTYCDLEWANTESQNGCGWTALLEII